MKTVVCARHLVIIFCFACFVLWAGGHKVWNKLTDYNYQAQKRVRERRKCERECRSLYVKAEERVRERRREGRERRILDARPESGCVSAESVNVSAELCTRA